MRRTRPGDATPEIRSGRSSDFKLTNVIGDQLREQAGPQRPDAENPEIVVEVTELR